MVNSIKYSLRLVLTLVFLDAAAAWPEALKASVEVLSDNTVFNRKTVSLSGQDFRILFGTLRGEASYGKSELSRDVDGLREWDDTFMSGMAGYRYQNGSLLTGADVSAGKWTAGDEKRSFVSASVPFQWAFSGSGFRLLSLLAIRQGAADDNPAATRIGIYKRTLQADAGIRYRDWELHGAYQQERYSSVPRADYQPFMADTAFFQAFYDILNPVLGFIETKTDPFPENEIRQTSVYGFGPLGSSFYMGASYVYRNTLHDFYLPIADEEDGRLVNTYFPYITPNEERVASLTTAFYKQWRSSAAWLNDISVKLDFPVYSSGRYRGFYRANAQNLLAGLQGFYYNYNGLGILTLDTQLGKKIGWGWGVLLRHQWVSRPYVSYRYFGRNAYQFQTFRTEIQKEW